MARVPEPKGHYRETGRRSGIHRSSSEKFKED